MMNKIGYLMVVPFIAIILFGCGSSNTENNSAAVDTSHKVDSVQLTPNFYKRIDGTIANNDVVMHLHAFEGELTGIYYYLKTGGWIMLHGKLDTNNINVFTLNESNFRDGESSGTLNCTYENGKITGSWVNPNGSQNYVIDLKENYPADAYTFGTFSVKNTEKAYPNKPESPDANISNTFVLSNQSGDIGKWINTKVIEALSVDSAYYNLDVVSAVKKMNERYLSDYHNMIKETNAGEDIPTFLNYESINELTVCFNNNGYVILANNNYDYSGGAHGNGGISFYCLDVVNKRKLSLQDVVATDSAILQPIVERTFRAAEKLKPTDSLNTILFENYLATTNNFYFTNKGIGFYYYPYEVAAYAVGSIHVFVPFTDLKPHLKPGFVQRMNLQ